MNRTQMYSTFKKTFMICVLVSALLTRGVEGCNIGFMNLGLGNIGVGNLGFFNKGFLNGGVKNIGVFNRKGFRNIGFANILCSNKIGFACIFGAPNLTPFGKKKK